MKFESPFTQLREAAVKAAGVSAARKQEERKDSLRDLLRWLLLVPLIFLLLFGCGWLATVGLPMASADTRSFLKADYGPWGFEVIQPVNPEIIQEIQKDQILYPSTFTEPVASTIVPAPFWPTPTPTPTPTPEPTDNPGPTSPASATPTPLTPTATHTNSPTPTASSTATPTLTPTPTSSSTPTRTPTSSPTPTRTPTRTSTPTRTNTPLPTATLAPTNTPVPPTATLAPTNTPVPPTATPTNTPVPPTATPTNTPVPPTATPTNTPVPPTATPTNTPVPPTATPTNTPTPVGPPQVDAVSSGDTRPASLTISHTTGAGSERLMLVGVSLNNDDLETVSSITYNGVGLTLVGEVNSADDSRVEIWRLIAPPTGTYDVVITFSAPLRRAALAGVMTFTGVHQTTPLGTFASAFGQNPAPEPHVHVSSTANELVFDTVSCELCTSLTVGAGQTQRWNVSEPSGGGPDQGAGSTEPGAATVTMSWTRGADEDYAIGAVPIKPSGGSAPAVDSVSSGQTSRTSMTISHTTSGAQRLMLVGVSINGNETVSSITYNGAALTLVGTAQQSTTSRVEIWRLVAPPTGTYNVVITFSANLAQGAKAGVMTFTGVDQTTPLGTFASANGLSLGPATVNVTSATNELVFDTVSCRRTSTGCTSLTIGAGQTQRWNRAENEGSPDMIGAGSTEPGAATVTMSWTLGGTTAANWAIGAVPIKPAP